MVKERGSRRDLKNWWDQSLESVLEKSIIEQQSYVNDLKGLLFEFEVIKQFFSSLITRHQWLVQIQQLPITSRLERSRLWIDEISPGLYELILQWSKKTTDAVFDFIELDRSQEISVEWLGETHDQGEADISLFLGPKDGAKRINISLKLAKWQSYVNTKSAGAKSFFSEYFSFYPSIGILQERWNHFCEESFEMMKTDIQQAFDRDCFGLKQKKYLLVFLALCKRNLHYVF